MMGAALGNLLVSLFGGIAGFFATAIGKKAAFGTAAVAVVGSLTVALFASVKGLVGLAYVSLPPFMATGLSMAVPENGAACIAAIVGTWSATTLYLWQRRNAELYAKVS